MKKSAAAYFIVAMGRVIQMEKMELLIAFFLNLRRMESMAMTAVSWALVFRSEDYKRATARIKEVNEKGR